MLLSVILNINHVLIYIVKLLFWMILSGQDVAQGYQLATNGEISLIAHNLQERKISLSLSHTLIVLKRTAE